MSLHDPPCEAKNSPINQPNLFILVYYGCVSNFKFGNRTSWSIIIVQNGIKEKHIWFYLNGEKYQSFEIILPNSPRSPQTLGWKKIVVSYEHLRCLPWTVTNHEIFIMVPIRYTWYTTVFVPSDQFQLCTSPSGSQTQPQTLWTGASQGIQEWLDKSWNILEPTRNNNHNKMEIIWYTTLYNVM